MTKRVSGVATARKSAKMETFLPAKAKARNRTTAIVTTRRVTRVFLRAMGGKAYAVTVVSGKVPRLPEESPMSQRATTLTATTQRASTAMGQRRRLSAGRKVAKPLSPSPTTPKITIVNLSGVGARAEEVIPV